MTEATRTESFLEVLERYPLDVVVPHSIRNELHRKGAAAAITDDIRSAPRFRTNGRGVLSWVSSPAPEESPKAAEQVIVRDLSKSGIRLLTSLEWHPEEVAKLQLEAGELTVRVIRVRRIGTKCCEVGCKLMKFARNSFGD